MFSGSFILAVHKSSNSFKYKNLTKSLCDSSNMICRNAFSISTENTSIDWSVLCMLNKTLQLLPSITNLGQKLDIYRYVSIYLSILIRNLVLRLKICFYSIIISKGVYYFFNFSVNFCSFTVLWEYSTKPRSKENFSKNLFLSVIGILIVYLHITSRNLHSWKHMLIRNIPGFFSAWCSA